MKLSARDQISGTIVTANITEQAIADFWLATGETVTVIVKASAVMIGK
ncbi:hypothetical protein F1C10_14300 [Sphingomonas sp. NBWT7]|nr:TOBE domain-containing protein [Sphingomonas sp. NBWT7]QNE32974.1 hypothetical protein F1C10_14300 [Sphingomonas sp. NBWT7]